MKKTTNWTRYVETQMRNPRMRALIEEELKALRVGVELAKLRQRRKLTQTQVAARAGMSTPNLSRIENNPSRNLTLGTLVRVAGAMNYEPQITFRPRRALATRAVVR